MIIPIANTITGPVPFAGPDHLRFCAQQNCLIQHLRIREVTAPQREDILEQQDIMLMAAEHYLAELGVF
jgi:hypothetical protein